MGKKLTNYLLCVARAKYGSLCKVLLIAYLLVFVAIRFLPWPHKAEVKLVTNIPPKAQVAQGNNSLENLTGGGTFALDRETFIASQETLLKSLPLYENVQKKAEAELVEMTGEKKQVTDYPLVIKKALQLALFGKEYTESLPLWRNSKYTKFKNRIAIIPHPEDGTFTISYTDSSPITAIKMASYISEALIDLNIKTAKEESTTIANFLKEKLEAERASWQEASLALANYLKENNLPSDAQSLRDRYNLYVSALRDGDNATRSKVKAEARLAETESYLKTIEDLINRSVLTNSDLRVENLLSELKRSQTAELSQRDQEEERGIASDYFMEQSFNIRQKIATEIAKYGAYIPLNHLLDVVGKIRLEIVKQRQSMSEESKYDEYTAQMLKKYEKEIQKYPEFQAHLNKLVSDIEQKTKAIENFNQEYLKYSVKSDSTLSRVYALQKPMITEDVFSSGKFQALLFFLCLATALVPMLVAFVHKYRGTVFSKNQLNRRADVRFIGAIPRFPALTKDFLSTFCNTHETLFKTSLECSHALNKSSGKGGKVITVTSHTPRSGTSLTAYGIAAGLKRLKKSVLVIDCDVLSATANSSVEVKGVTQYFVSGSEDAKNVIDAEALLTNLLANPQEKTPGIQFVKMYRENTDQGIYIEILKDKFATQIEKLKGHFDYVILDGPALSVTEGMMLIEKADGIILSCPEANITVEEYNQALMVINQHKADSAIVMSLIANAKIPRNLTVEEVYVLNPFSKAA